MLTSTPAREWSRRDASDIDGQAERPKRAGANESILSELGVPCSGRRVACDLATRLPSRLVEP
jgi:hypothetical protein